MFYFLFLGVQGLGLSSYRIFVFPFSPFSKDLSPSFFIYILTLYRLSKSDFLDLNFVGYLSGWCDPRCSDADADNQIIGEMIS